MRNRTLTNREKNCRQGRFAAEADLEIVKGFRSQGVHNILYATRKFVIIKWTSKISFIVNKNKVGLHVPMSLWKRHK
jgi:hypothetical protein